MPALLDRGRERLLGILPGGRLDVIGETVMERIASGEYDYRKNSV